MEPRKMLLPDGWYPHSPEAAAKMLQSWVSRSCSDCSEGIAGIAPHAGWDFSGSIAWNIIRSIPPDCELIIIGGGHLSSDSACRVLDYDSLETPFGELNVHTSLLDPLCGDFVSDRDSDNTVEIMLPMIKYAHPHVSVLAVRLPSSSVAAEWGRYCGVTCREKGINAFFLGSTDLSHYGPRFRYVDYGYGEKARHTIREYDREYLKFLTELNSEDSIKFAMDHNTACSAGAAAAAVGFAQESGSREGILREHRYSYDIYDSGADFVGYGSILYR